MKRILAMLAMLLCVASACYAAEERTTAEIFADPTIAEVTITGDQLRLRTHPDLDGYIIKKLDKGTVCKFMNRVEDKNGTDSWVYIILPDGSVGWVFGSYVKIEGNVSQSQS